MAVEQDYAMRDLGRLKLTLRSDLVFTPHQSGGDSYIVIEDPMNSRFHRVGFAEYVFVSLLDGATTIAAAMQLAAEASPDYALSEREAAAICRWLVESGLACTRESATPARLTEKANDLDERQLSQRWNPVSMRWRLFCPDRLFESMAPWLGWVHAPWAIVVWAFTLAVAAYFVFSNWGLFAASSEGILAPGNWMWLAICGLGLKVVHELSHGLACKRYGGSIREVGILLILCVPLPYVDVTSCWGFRSKWQRIQTSAAGMYVELFVAAIAAMVWSATGPGILNHVCYNLILAASVMTFAVNANPLMRFDGYYILSDLIEVPNLYSNGQEFLRCLGRRYLLAVDASRPVWSRSRAAVITGYGCAAIVWRVMICTSLVIAASALFHGAGLVLSCLAVILWAVLPIVRFVCYLLRGHQGERPSLRRFTATVGTAAVACGFVLGFVPWPGKISAPAIVEYRPLRVVRASSPGFLSELKTRSSEQVERGETIAVLENDELKFELAELEIAIEQSEIRCRALQQAREMASYQAEREQQAGLIKRRNEKRTQVDELVVRAEINGRIIGRNLENMIGSYFQEGSTIASLGHTTRKEIVISVGDDDIDAFIAWINRPATVRIGSLSRFQSKLVKLDPQARREPPHPSLSAHMGGPLAVKKRTVSSNDSGVTEQRYELISPRFVGSVELEATNGSALRAGQRGTVSIRPFHETIGRHLGNAMTRWIRDRIQFHVGT